MVLWCRAYATPVLAIEEILPVQGNQDILFPRGVAQFSMLPSALPAAFLSVVRLPRVHVPALSAPNLTQPKLPVLHDEQRSDDVCSMCVP